MHIKNKKRGFSLVELLIAFTILALLAALLIPSLLTSREDARVKADKAAVATLESTVQMAMQSNMIYNKARIIADKTADNAITVAYTTNDDNILIIDKVFANTNEYGLVLDTSGSDIGTELSRIKNYVQTFVLGSMDQVQISSEAYRNKDQYIKIIFTDVEYRVVASTEMVQKVVDGGECYCTPKPPVKIVNAVEPSCLEEGYTGDTICSGCGVILEKGETIEAKGHMPVLKGTIASTCVSDGYTGDSVCDVCNTLLGKGNATPAGGHSYQVSEKHDPTCTAAGYTKYECVHCGHNKEDTVAPLGHANTEMSGFLQATCITNGYTGDTVCTRCGKVMKKGQVVAATGHSYEATITTEPTCTTAGVKTYKCKTCGHTQLETIAELGHNIILANKKDATCTTNGYTGDKTCVTCGQILEAGKTLVKKGHKEVVISSIPVTCTEDGSETVKCVVCGNVETRTIECMGHISTILKNRVLETCMSKGYTGDTFCTICNIIVEEGEEVEPSGHNYSEISHLPAKCLSDGLITYKCTYCSITKTEKLEATGHANTKSVNVEEATCLNNGYTGDIVCADCEVLLERGQPIYTGGHKWHSLELVEATCSSRGYERFECELCGETETVYTNAYAHEETAIVGQIEMTCDYDGYTGDEVCLKCNTVVKYGDIIMSPGHNKVIIEEVQPQCETDGHVTFECTICNQTITDYVPATGHQTELQNIQSATCEQDGNSGDEICLICGKTIKSGTITEAFGHDEVVRYYKEATCTEDGYSGDKYCSRCGKKTQEGNIIPKTSHNFLTQDEKQATCITDGYKDVICDTCGYYERQVTAQAHGHVNTTQPTTDATCVTPGVTGQVICGVCGLEIYEGTTTEALGHDFVLTATYDPECESRGIYEYTCTRCEAMEMDRWGEPLGHIRVVRNKTEYYSGDVYCSRCNEKLESGTYKNSLTIDLKGGMLNGATGVVTISGNPGTSIQINLPTQTGNMFAGYTASAPERFAEFQKMDIHLYNNLYNNQISIVETTIEADPESNYTGTSAYKITVPNGTKAHVHAEPGFGGFYTPIYGKPGAIYVHSFYAKLPVGYEFGITSNDMGDGYNLRWLTNSVGTGEWELYAYRIECGTTGNFSFGGHVCVMDNGSTNGFTWYMAEPMAYNMANGSFTYTFNEKGENAIARWAEVDASILTLMLYDGNLNGATTDVEVVGFAGDKVTIPSPTKEGHIFAGWQGNNANAFSANKIPGTVVQYTWCGDQIVPTLTMDGTLATIDGYEMGGYKITVDKNSVKSPNIGYGGICYSYVGQNNHTYIASFYAKLPVGSHLAIHHNSIGDGGHKQWLTSNLGTGEWELYAYELHYGSGSVSDMGYLAMHTQSAGCSWEIVGYMLYDITADNQYTFSNNDELVRARWARNTKVAYDFSGQYETFIAPEDGTYFLEVWGAQGGSTYGTGGYGGYSNGYVNLKKGEELYVYVGQQPTSLAGGWNGGGVGETSPSSAVYRSAGGGATDIRRGSHDLENRIIVAGGGGGGADYAGPIPGGAGGGLQSGNVYYSHYNTAEVWKSANIGASVSHGGAAALDGAAPGGDMPGLAASGSLGQGAGSCGGGYYGGPLYGCANRVYSGGGGSGYIGGVYNGHSEIGATQGNGRASITLVTKNTEIETNNTLPGISVFTVPQDGTYKLEAWGAQGGGSRCDGAEYNNGALGGYAVGIIEQLQKGQTLIMANGGQGQAGVIGGNAQGGINGGGYGSWDGSDDDASGGGGGASDIAIGNWLTVADGMNDNNQEDSDPVNDSNATVNGNVWLLQNANQGIHLHTGMGGLPDSMSGDIIRYDIIGQNLDAIKMSRIDPGVGTYTGGIAYDWVYGIDVAELVRVYISENHLQIFIKHKASGTSTAIHLYSNGEPVKIDGVAVVNLRNRLLVAGGGGGTCWNDAGGGGVGGGLTGGISANTIQTPATQTSGYMFGLGQDGVTSGQEVGGNYEGVGGGGGGWYGGLTQDVYHAASGGGGSGYVGGVYQGSMQSGVNAGNGKTKITLMSALKNPPAESIDDIAKKGSLSEYTWEEIKLIADSDVKLSDYNIEIGAKKDGYTLVDDARENHYNGLVFMFKAIEESPDVKFNNVMSGQQEGHVIGGYKASALRVTVEDVFNTLPYNVRNVIKSVPVYCNNNAGPDANIVEKIEGAKIFVPSITEMGVTADNSMLEFLNDAGNYDVFLMENNEAFDYFADKNTAQNRISTFSDSMWYARTVSQARNHPLGFMPNGSLDRMMAKGYEIDNAEGTMGVVVAFVVGEQNITKPTAKAILCENHTLTFVKDKNNYLVGMTFDNSKITAVYTDFEDIARLAPWLSNASTITKVIVRDKISPITTTNWFSGFVNCAYFDLANLDTSNVRIMDNMFVNCSSIQTLDVSNFDTSRVTSMWGVFGNTYALNTLDLSGWDTSRVKYMHYMFNECGATTVYVSDKWTTESVTLSAGMMAGATKIKGGAGTTYNSNYIDMTYARIDKGSSEPGYFTDSLLKIAPTGYYKIVSTPNEVLYKSEAVDRTYSKVNGDAAIYTTALRYDTDDDRYWYGPLLISKTIDGTQYKTSGNHTDSSSEPMAFEYNGETWYVSGGQMEIQTTAGYVPQNTQFINSATGVLYSATDRTCLIQAAIDTLNLINGSQMKSYAVYSSTDNSLTFYKSDEPYRVNQFRNGKQVTAVWTNFEHTYFNSDYQTGVCEVPWVNYATSIKSVKFEDKISPTYTRGWFYNFRNCTSWDLAKLDTSSTLNMVDMFIAAGSDVERFEVDISHFNTQACTNISSMFNRSGENSKYWNVIGLDKLNTANVTSLHGLFYRAGHNAENTITLDMYNWDMRKVTDVTAMFDSNGVIVGTLEFNNTSSLSAITNCFASMKHDVWLVGSSSQLSALEATDGVTNGGKAQILTGTYKRGSLTMELPYDGMPNVAMDGDILTTADYEYRYGKAALTNNWQSGDANGWGVKQISSSKTSYGKIVNAIANKKVTTLQFTFYGSKITTPVEIPATVTNATGMFYQCYNLQSAPKLPNSLVSINRMFEQCHSLATYVGSNDNSGDFSNYNIPNGVQDMQLTFRDCPLLVKAPAIPNTVTTMANTFDWCVGLTDAPVIPSSVTNMSSTFIGCSSLNGAIVINATPSAYTSCFNSVDFASQKVTLIGAGNNLDTLGATGTNYCTSCNGYCVEKTQADFGANNTTTLTNSVSGNYYTNFKIQIWDSNWSQFLLQPISALESGSYNIPYTHPYPSGYYVVRAALNANQKDADLGNSTIYLVENATYTFSFDLTWHSNQSVTISNLKIKSAPELSHGELITFSHRGNGTIWYSKAVKGMTWAEFMASDLPTTEFSLLEENGRNVVAVFEHPLTYNGSRVLPSDLIIDGAYYG